MKLDDATAVALDLIEQMEPFCERIDVAGSIRRECPEVRDIEIVAIPRWEKRPMGVPDLFGRQELALVNTLRNEWAMHTSAVQWIKPGTSASVPWGVQENGRYWRGLLPCGVKLDLFLTTAEGWGVIHLIRTGSADFSQAVATRAKKIGRPFNLGRMWIDDTALETQDEADVFRLLRLDYVAPRDRHGAHNLIVRE